MSDHKKPDGSTADSEETDDSETTIVESSTVSTSYEKVIGETGQSNAAGVHGHTTATTGQTFGVVGETDSSGTGAAGVRGDATAGSGEIHGVHGFADSSNDSSSGVYGQSTDGGAGVKAEIYGTKSDLPGPLFTIDAAVLGFSEGFDNHAGFFWSADETGVTGRTDDPSQAAVIGYNSAGGPGLRLNNSHVSIANVGVEAHQTSTVSVPDTGTTVVYDDEIVDDRNEYDPKTGEFTCAYGGDFQVEAQVEWETGIPDGTGIFIKIQVNGSTEIQNYSECAQNTQGPTHGISKTVRNLTQGDVITITADHDDGGNSWDLSPFAEYAQLTISQIG